MSEKLVASFFSSCFRNCPVLLVAWSIQNSESHPLTSLPYSLPHSLPAYSLFWGTWRDPGPLFAEVISFRTCLKAVSKKKWWYTQNISHVTWIFQGLHSAWHLLRGQSCQQCAKRTQAGLHFWPSCHVQCAGQWHIFARTWLSLWTFKRVERMCIDSIDYVKWLYATVHCPFTLWFWLWSRMKIWRNAPVEGMICWLDVWKCICIDVYIVDSWGTGHSSWVSSPFGCFIWTFQHTAAITAVCL